MSIAAIAATLTGPVAGLISEFITDKDKAAELAHDISTMAAQNAHAQVMGQLEVNKQEAGHRSILVAGWRPFIGWTCGGGLFYNVLLHPIMDIWFEMPVINPDLLYPVMLGMLGLGGTTAVARTVEKLKGAAR